MEFGPDIPDGVARLEALQAAVALASPDETDDQVMARAERMYRFLTVNRQTSNSFQPLRGVAN